MNYKLTFFGGCIAIILFFVAVFYLIGLQHSAYGWHNSITGNIIINTRDIKTYEDALYTFSHEYGHHAYEQLSDEQKEEWRKIHKSTNSVTPYGDTNEQEDFAESYAHYKINPNNMEAQRYIFMVEVRE